MFLWMKNKAPVWLACGIVVGVALGGIIPHAPLHTVATDRQDTLALSTGQVDDGVEAVFTLDFLTGDLHGAVLNPGTRTFTATYHRNITEDLKVETGKNPKYVMVTGQTYLRTGSNFRLSPCAIYIAELTSGNMAVYSFAYNPSVISRPGYTAPQEFIPLQVVPFRSAAIR
jgi:hypothetical protein